MSNVVNQSSLTDLTIFFSSQSATGGGFFGDVLPEMEMSLKKMLLIIIQVLLQLYYAYWNFMTLFSRDRYDIIEQQQPIDDGLHSESHTEVEIT